MINFKEVEIGTKVHYQPNHYKIDNKWENGIVKELRSEQPDVAWVVYKCAQNWIDYKQYTSARTDLRDLKLGWRKGEKET